MQRRERAVELGVPVAHRDHHGELARVDARHVREIGYAEVGGEQPLGQVPAGRVGDGDATDGRALRQAHRGRGGAADQEPVRIGTVYAAREPDPEPVRQAHPLKPPSARTTDPLSAAPAGEQHSAIVAAISSGAISRRMPCCSASSSGVVS